MRSFVQCNAAGLGLYYIQFIYVHCSHLWWCGDAGPQGQCV